MEPATGKVPAYPVCKYYQGLALALGLCKCEPRWKVCQIGSSWGWQTETRNVTKASTHTGMDQDYTNPEHSTRGERTGLEGKPESPFVCALALGPTK